MVSDDTAWSSGAKGIARDAETAARLTQIANADAASIFIDFVLSSFAAMRQFYTWKKMWRAGLTSGGGASGDASDGDAGPNGGGASPSDGGASDAIAGASDVPSALVRA